MIPRFIKKIIKQMKQLLEKEHFDIIHCHTPMGSVVTRLAAKKARKNGTRVIYTAHGFHFYTGAPLINWLLFYPVEWYLAKYTDTLITINHEDYNRAKKKFSKRCHDIQYVPGVGIDPKKFDFKMTKKEKHELRASLGLKDDDFVMIFPAELSKRKNQMWLIKTLEPLFREHDEMHLLLPGRDNLNGKCQKLAEKLNVKEQVHFLGFRDDIPRLLKISDLELSSAKQEGLPINIIEAMQCNMPIVSLRCRGCIDLLGENRCADIKDGVQYVRMIKKILNTRKTELEYHNEYTIENILPVMEAIYNRKMRVLHILSSNVYSGAENVACSIILNSVNYSCAYCSPRGEIEKALKKLNIEYYGLAKMSLREINEVIKKYKPDILHAHDYKASILAAIAKNKDCILISHIHKNDPSMSKIGLKSILYSICQKKINKIVLVSQEIENESPLIKKEHNKVVILHPFVDKKDILTKAQCQAKIDPYDILFFGRLSQEKNPLLFLDIVKKINYTNVKAVILGDGPLMEACRNKVKIEKIKNVTFLGFKENPYPYIKNAKVCIMPSSFEGFGISAIEVLLLGIPVLNSGVGGLGYIFKDNTHMICRNEEEYIKKAEYYISNHKKAHYGYDVDINDYRNQITSIYGAN